MKKILFSLLMFVILCSTANAASILVVPNSYEVAVEDTITVTVTVNGEDADAWNYCLKYSGPVNPQGSTCVKAGSITDGRSNTFTFKTTAKGIVTFGIDSYEVLNYKAEDASVFNGSAAILVNKKGETGTDELIPVYRMYNRYTGEHLYTTDTNEVDYLYKKQKWGKEGVAWYSYKNVGTPVYRLYNPLLGNHLYTSDLNEIDILTNQHGWVLDFNGTPAMYSNGNISIYRLFNSALKGQHHLTTDENEYNVIPKWGWQQEGISLKAVKIGVPEKTSYYK